MNVTCWSHFSCYSCLIYSVKKLQSWRRFQNISPTWDFTSNSKSSWNLADHRIPVNTIQALVSGSFGRSKTFELYLKCFARSVFIQFFYWSGNIYRHIRWSKLWKLVAKLATISISALLTCWSCWEWLTTSGFMQPLASCGLKQSVLVSYLAINGIAVWLGAYHKHKVRTERRRGFCA